MLLSGHTNCPIEEESSPEQTITNFIFSFQRSLHVSCARLCGQKNIENDAETQEEEKQKSYFEVK